MIRREFMGRDVSVAMDARLIWYGPRPFRTREFRLA